MRSRVFTLRFLLCFLLIPSLVLISAGQASARDAASEFHELFKATLPEAWRVPDALAVLHMLPDEKVLEATQASSVNDALDLVSRTNLENLVRKTLQQQSTNTEVLDVDSVLRDHPITLVIVPGIFGEFIPTRGFEDVLAKPSSAREEFKSKLKGGDSALTFDTRFSMKSLSREAVPLNDVVNVGSLSDANGKVLVRVVLLYTSFMSLESLGDLRAHAEIFNRRLSKYLALTGPQDLALIGYSRGTDLALEMLAQAKAQNVSWLGHVRAVFGLGGVIWGSALADETQNSNSPMKGLVDAVQTLRNDLNPASKLRTFATWARFAKTFASLYPTLSQKPNAPKAKDLVNSQVPTSLDPKSILSLVKLGWKHLGLSSPKKDFALNVRRFQALVDSVLSGADSLTSKSRTAWWASHELPSTVTYYAITATMANPEASEFERNIFDNKFGYSHRSYDDLMLLQNRLDYENLTKVSLNDSQVSVAQAMFLPNVIAKLNPVNRGLKTEMLGTMGTHHWGLALKVVNAMKDGRENPFPRESLLKAMAAKTAFDLAFNR